MVQWRLPCRALDHFLRAEGVVARGIETRMPGGRSQPDLFFALIYRCKCVYRCKCGLRKETNFCLEPLAKFWDEGTSHRSIGADCRNRGNLADDRHCIPMDADLSCEISFTDDGASFYGMCWLIAHNQLALTTQRDADPNPQPEFRKQSSHSRTGRKSD